MSDISRETLRKYLQNRPLVQALRNKAEADETRKNLHHALTVMQAVGVGEAAQAEVMEKLNEYQTIVRNYGNMIEDSWHITWQKESIIRKYLEYDIDDLPEIARF